MNKNILNWIIGIAIIFIVFGSFIILEEILTAKNFCKEQDSKFNIDFGKYYCNESQIYKYTDGWDFERPDLNNITISVP